jgi:hypothetical protein
VASILTDNLRLQLIEKSAHLYEKWHYLQSLFVLVLALGLNKFLAKFKHGSLQEPSTVNGANNSPSLRGSNHINSSLSNATF